MRNGIRRLVCVCLAVFMACGVFLAACAPTEEEPTHTHTFSTEWTYNKDEHWHAATCGHTGERSDVAPHVMEGNTCSVCGYTEEEEPSEPSSNVEGVSFGTATPETMPEQPALAKDEIVEPAPEETEQPTPPKRTEPVAPQTMVATQAAYAWISTTGGTNYTDNFLRVTNGTIRYTFLQFDINGYEDSLDYAILRMYIQKIDSGYRYGSYIIDVYAFKGGREEYETDHKTKNDWTSTSLTGISAGGTAEVVLGEKIGSMRVGKTAGTYAEADLTDFVKDYTAETGEKTFSIVLVNSDPSFQDGKSSIYFERNAEGKQPALLLGADRDAVEITDVGVEAEKLTLYTNETNKRIAADPQPGWAGNRGVFYESSEQSVVTVDAAGRLTPVGIGKATVTVSAACGTASHSVEVTVEEAPQGGWNRQLSPVADTDIRYLKSDASTATTNYADETELYVSDYNVNKNDTEYYNRSLLSFDLSSFGGASFASAVLRLTVSRNTLTNDLVNVRVYAVQDFDLSTITFDSYERMHDDPIGSYEVLSKKAGDVVEIDLTSWLNEHFSEELDVVTLVIELETEKNGGTRSQFAFYASEAEDEAVRPVLTVEGTDVAGIEAENQAAAQEVIDAIAAIGTVDADSWAKITQAIIDYNALTDVQKRLVTNVQTLKDAQTAFDEAGAEAGANAIVYPKPEGYMTSVTDEYEERYHVAVGNKKVPVYPAQSVYDGDLANVSSYVRFDFIGEVTVDILVNFDFKEVVVRPLSAGVTPEVNGRHIRLHLTAASNLSVEFDNDTTHNLQVFTNPVYNYDFSDENVYNIVRVEAGAHEPDEILAQAVTGKTNVFWFAPGIHAFGNYDTDVFFIPSNSVVYLEGGSVFEGRLHAKEANNIKIVGSGVISGEKLTREMPLEAGGSTGDYPAYFLLLHKCTNVEINGIVLSDSPSWTFVPIESEQVYVNNLRIVGQHRSNNDGMDITNCRNITINNCYTRTIDDGITIKGKYLDAERGKVADITYQNSVMWNYAAGQALQLGSESCADYYNNIVFRNVDIIHNDSACALSIENMDSAHYTNIYYDDIRIEADAGTAPSFSLISIRISDNYYASDVERGTIDNVVYSNISYLGTHTNRGILINGCDAEHMVQNVSFYNVRMGDKVLNASNANLSMNAYVENVSFYTGSYNFNTLDLSGQLFEAEDAAAEGIRSYDSELASGGSYVRADMNVHTTLTYTLNVTEARHYVPHASVLKFASGGMFRVAIDGEDLGVVVNTYAPSAIWQDVILPCVFLTEGTHTVTFTCVGRHSAAEDTDLALDYIRFTPTDDDTFESENMTVTGAVRVQDGTASGGYYYRTEGAAAGSTVTLVTDNSYARERTLRVKLAVGPQYGKVIFTVNGVQVGEEVDAYAAEEGFAQFELGGVELAAGTVTVTAEVTGKNELATGYEVGIDAFKLIPPRRGFIWRTARIGTGTPSQGVSVRKTANAIGGYVEATMPKLGDSLAYNTLNAPFGGLYRIVCLMQQGPTLGVFDVYLGDTLLAENVDFYQPVVGRNEYDFGIAELQQGSVNSIRFVSKGKNEAVTNAAYVLGVYDFKFLPVSSYDDVPAAVDPVVETRTVDPASCAYLEFTFDGLAAGDRLTADIAFGGETVSKVTYLISSGNSILIDVADSLMTESGEYTFTFSAAKFAAPKETQLTGVTVYSREVNIFASSEGWYTPSGGSGSTIAIEDGGATITKGTASFTWVTKTFTIDPAVTQYLVYDCTSVSGSYAIKLENPDGSGNDIVLVNDTSSTGRQFVDLTGFIKEAGDYTLKLFNVGGTTVRFGDMWLLSAQ